MRQILAIDPGKSGGYAIMTEDGDCTLHSWTTPADIVLHLNQFNKPDELFQAVIESVHSSPQMGVKSSFSFGENFGMWQGILAGYRIPTEFIKPQVWQRMIPGRSGAKGNALKKILKAHAQARFPNVEDITLKTCDALLIADWYRNK